MGGGCFGGVGSGNGELLAQGCQGSRVGLSCKRRHFAGRQQRVFGRRPCQGFTLCDRPQDTSFGQCCFAGFLGCCGFAGMLLL